MAKITAAEFQRKIGYYQDEAARAPVVITRNGRDRLVLLSIEAYQALLDYQSVATRTAVLRTKPKHRK